MVEMLRLKTKLKHRKPSHPEFSTHNYLIYLTSSKLPPIGQTLPLIDERMRLPARVRVRAAVGTKIGWSVAPRRNVKPACVFKRFSGYSDPPDAPSGDSRCDRGIIHDAAIHYSDGMYEVAIREGGTAAGARTGRNITRESLQQGSSQEKWMNLKHRSRKIIRPW